MSAERDELIRLARNLSDEQVPDALATLQRHLRAMPDSQWPPVWFAAAPGHRRDASERGDHLLDDGFHE